MNVSRDKITGMFLGVAIGDALYMPIETWTSEQILEKYGRLTTYVRPDGHKWFNGRGSGTWTDDTQLTLVVAESIIEHKKLNLDDLAKRHIASWKKEGNLGFGKTTNEAIQKLYSGIHWSKSGKNNNPKHGFGNGIAMKVSPIGALRASPLWSELWVESRSEFINNTVELTLMTHHTRMAVDSALAHVFAISCCLDQNFSVKNFITGIRRWTDFLIYDEVHNVTDRLSDRFAILDAIDPASLTTKEVIDLFGGGTSYVYNSLPFSYAFFLRNPYSIETLYDVGNAGGDTDTNASIVGGLLGALNGASIFPQHLIDGLWQKDRILATANKFYETFFEQQKDPPTRKATEDEGSSQCK